MINHGQKNPNRRKLIQVNTALSNLHGEEIRNMAVELTQYKREIYAQLKDSTNHTLLKAYLDKKVGKYMKEEYENKYGKLEKWEEAEKFDRDQKMKFDELKGMGVGNQFGSRISMLRKINGVKEDLMMEE